MNDPIRIFLTIDEDIIKKSRRRSNLSSPIGLALRELGFTNLSVKPTRALIQEDDGTIFEAKLRGDFKKFQDDYLAGKKLNPISGELVFFDLKQIQREIHLHLESRAPLAEREYPR